MDVLGHFQSFHSSDKKGEPLSTPESQLELCEEKTKWEIMDKHRIRKVTGSQ